MPDPRRKNWSQADILKYEVAAELGLLEKVLARGWAGLSTAEFVDIDSVQVVRGPVGTQGGKNASIGGVYLTTKAPSFTPSTDVSLRFGQRDAVFGSAAITGPLIEDLLAWRGTFYVSKQEGAFKNLYNDGDSTYNDRNKISGKVQFLLTPSSNFSARVIANIDPRTWQNDNGLTFRHAPLPTYSNGSPNNLANDAQTRLGRRWFTQLGSYNYNDSYLNYATGTQNNDEQRALYTGTRGLSANLTWDLGSHTFSSITAWQSLYFDARNDEGTPFDISTQGGGGVRYKQYTQEFRLASAQGGDVDYQTGIYLIKNKHEVDSKSGWGSDAGAWFANAGQYSRLDADGAGRQLLANSLDQTRKIGIAVTNNFSPAVYGQANWRVGGPWTITTGARVTRENRKASNFARIEDNGKAPELNPSISTAGVALGGFDSYYNATSSTVLDGRVVAAGTAGATAVAANSAALTTDTTSGARLAQANIQANAAAQKYFGVSTWAGLSAAQKRQLVDAQALRKSQLGLLYDQQSAEDIRQTQVTFNISPSYKINDNLTTYATYQYGEKAPVAQFVNGFSANAKPEKTNNFELGLKASLLERTLTLNADIFLSNIKDYQQSAQVVDEFTTGFNNDGTIYYTSLTGNAPKVQVKGLEIDGYYTGIQHTTLRFAAAYNDARYKSFPNSPQPAENNYTGAAPFQDISGRTLPGASKFTANIGVEYRLPVLGLYEFHTDLNHAYIGGYNTDVTLSQYGWVNSYQLTDLGVGIGQRNRAWDVTFLVKNLTNEWARNYGFSTGSIDATPRWIGLVFNAKL